METFKEKKRILHIVDGLGHGGAETLVITLLKALSDDYEIHLIVLGKPHTLLNAVPGNVCTKLLNFKGYKDLPKCILFVRRYIRQNNICLVHSHLYWSNVVSRIATPRKVPVFNCIQNISSMASYAANRASLYLDRLTYGKRHYIIAVSKVVLDDFDQWVGLKGNSIVLYNIIGDEFFKAEPKRHFSTTAVRLVAVGNLRKQKNYPYVIEAFKSMPANVSLDIYGVGPLKDELQREIDQHQLNIRLCGLQPNMHEVLPHYDAFVMCSTHEGLSLALMEAMASGLPVFLSDIPVQRESAEDSAVYFDLAHPQDFVNKLLATFHDAGRLQIMSKAGIERAKHLAKKDNYIDRLRNLYDKA
jgi:glycosyltransferase involved in cell wall biosynthesis